MRVPIHPLKLLKLVPPAILFAGVLWCSPAFGQTPPAKTAPKQKRSSCSFRWPKTSRWMRRRTLSDS